MSHQRLPVLRPDAIVRALERAGFSVHRVKGSHHHLRNPDRPHAQLCLCNRRDLPPGTLRMIIKQAGMSVAESLDLL